MKIVENKPKLIKNAIAYQNKTTPNSLTVHEWNHIINVLKTQTNLNTEYLDKLHSILFGSSESDFIETPSLPEVKELIADLEDFKDGWNINIENQINQAVAVETNAREQLQEAFNNHQHSYDEIIDKPVSVIFEITGFTELTPLQKTTITNQLMSLLNDNLTDLDTNKYSDLILRYLDERYHYSSVAVIDGEVVRILFDYKNEDTKIKLDINFVGDDSQTVIELVTINYELEGTVSTHNASETAHPFLQGKIDEARAIAEGKVGAMSFATKEDLDDWLEIPGNVETLLVGTNFYIEDLTSPDYWWNGTTLVELSTDKIDLTEYAKSDDLATVATTGSYSDLTNTPTIPALSYDIVTDLADTTKAATPNAVGNYTYSRSAIDTMIGDIPTIRPTIELEVASLTTLTELEKLTIKNQLSSLIVDDKIDGSKFDDIVLVTTNDLIRLHYSSIDYYVANPQITVIFETDNTKYILHVPLIDYTYSTLTSTTTTIPTISTSITTDATSDTKTASPKAVKTYVDNAINSAILGLLGGES